MKAWLFHFRDDDYSSAWRKEAGRGRIAQWKVTRSISEMNKGDIVFFWQSGKSGGLCGWGEIKSGDVLGSETPSIAVVEHAWLAEPIPRRLVFSKHAISSKDFSRSNAQGTNFRLSPHEAAALAKLFPIPASRAVWRSIRMRLGLRKQLLALASSRSAAR